MRNPIAVVGALECGCTYRAIRDRRLRNFELIERCSDHAMPDLGTCGANDELHTKCSRPDWRAVVAAEAPTAPTPRVLPAPSRSTAGSAFYRPAPR